MDFETSLRRAIKSGKVIFGQNETKNSVESGNSKMVIVAGNCPEEFQNYLSEKDIFVYKSTDSSVQLGKASGNPYMVSALSIEDAGESDILTLKKE